MVAVLGMGTISVAEDLKTGDGRHYRQIKVVQVDPNGIFIRHAKGVAKVHFDDLDKATRERFGYDSGEAGRFEMPRTEEEPPARPAPPPGGFQEGGEGTRTGGGAGNGGGGHTFGPIMASVQYNVVPSGYGCLPYGPLIMQNPYGMLGWRHRSLCDLLAASGISHRRPQQVAPWIWGGYRYPVFKR